MHLSFLLQTDLAFHDSFTTALKRLGNKLTESGTCSKVNVLNLSATCFRIRLLIILTYVGNLCF